jgi:hypothetical protein
VIHSGKGLAQLANHVNRFCIAHAGFGTFGDDSFEESQGYWGGQPEAKVDYWGHLPVITVEDEGPASK